MGLSAGVAAAAAGGTALYLLLPRILSSFHPAQPPLPSCTTTQGYKLTDRRDGSSAWAFPPGASLAAGQYLLVFASSKDRAAPGKPLHTSFKLSADDGYLALLAPSGTPASEVQFPQ